MALLVEQLQWSEPLAPETIDPAWEDEVRGLFGGYMPRSPSSASPRAPGFDAPIWTPSAARWRRLARSEQELAGLVTSQENACRYCYGSARVRMKMIGFSDEMIDRIERNAQLVEAEPRERELVHFCRNLARSKPRPSRQARETDARGRLQRRSRPRSWRYGRDRRLLQPRLDACWRCRRSSRWRQQAKRTRGCGTSCPPGCPGKKRQ